MTVIFIIIQFYFKNFTFYHVFYKFLFIRHQQVWFSKV